MKKLAVVSPLLSLAFIAVGSMAWGAAAGTARWTGPSSGGDWSSAANWTFEPSTLSVADFATKVVNYDFTGLADGATVTIPGTVWCFNNVTFPENASVKLTGGTATDIKLGKDTATFNIPAGSTVTWSLRHPIDWAADKDFTVKGGGTFVYDGTGVASFEFYNGKIVVDDSTFVIRALAGTSKNFQMTRFLMKNKAKVKLECNAQFGSIHSDASTKPATGVQELDIGSLTLILSSMTSGEVADFNGKVTTSDGTIQLAGGSNQTFSNPQAVGSNVTIQHARLAFAEETSLSDSVSCSLQLGGTLAFAGSQTLASLATSVYNSRYGYVGGVEIADDKTLTVGTNLSRTDNFYGSIRGGGSLVKDGAGYTLALNGSSRYAGTTEVKAGTLQLNSGLTAVSSGSPCRGAVVHLTFDNPAALNANGVSGGLTLTQTGTPVSTNGIVGKAVYFPTTSVKFSLKDACLPQVGEPYTVSFWMKPNADMSDGASYYQFFLHGSWDTDKSLRWIAFAPKKENDDWQGFSYLGMRSIIRGPLPDGGTGASLDTWRYFIHDQVQTMALIADEKWHHFALTEKDGKRRAFIDGQLVSSDASAYARDWANLVNDLTVGGFRGCMDEFVYAREAWTDAEVLNEYNRLAKVAFDATYDPSADLPSPVAHWAFEDPADIGKDSSGNGYDLEPFGNTAKVVLQENRPGAYGRYALVLNDGKNSGASSSTYGALRLKGDVFPAKIQTGTNSFSVSARYQMPYETGYTVAYWGGAELNTNRYFRIKCGSQPHTPRGDFSRVSSQNNDYHNATLSSGIYMGQVVSESSWMHVVFTYDGASRKLRLYTDGVYEKETTAGVAVGGKTTYPDILGEVLYVGYANDVTGTKTYCFSGLAMDDLRIYDRVLTEDEVIALTRSLETGRIGPTLPEGTDLKVDAGATVAVAGAGHAVDKLEGSGTVSVGADANLEVRGESAFAGALTGFGCVRAGEGAKLTLSGALTGFDGTLEAVGGSITASALGSGASVRIGSGGQVLGTGLAANVTLEEGLVIQTDPAKTGLPVVRTSGKVVLPETGTVVIDNLDSVTDNVFVLAEAGSFAAPADFSGWNLQGLEDSLTVNRAIFEIRDGAFCLRLRFKGMAILIR